MARKKKDTPDWLAMRDPNPPEEYNPIYGEPTEVRCARCGCSEYPECLNHCEVPIDYFD